MKMKSQMAFLRKPTSYSIALLLLLLLLLVFTCNFNLASASSGGVMGGSFFNSDSSSSESERDPVMDHHHYHHHIPSPHADNNYDSAKESHGGGPIWFLIIFVFGFFLIGFCKDNNGNTITVFNLQIAMLDGMKNTIQRDLNRIAEAADTSSREGVSYLLLETIQTLERHHGYCTAGYSSVNLKRSREDGEKCYDQLSNEERAKFDEETLVKLNSKYKTSSRNQSYDRFSNQYTMLDVESRQERETFETEKLLSGSDEYNYIVVTVLVAATGAHKLPNINGAEDLRKVLQMLKPLLPKNLVAGEVLWTPQKEGDILSEQKLRKDYPQLAEGMKSFLVKKQE